MCQMELAGEYQIAAPREEVWPLIFDPENLAEWIPGCDSLQQISQDRYQGQMILGIAGVGGRFSVQVQLTEYQPPQFCSFNGDLAGSAGNVNGSARFELEAVDAGTIIHYSAKGLVTGALGKLSARLVEGFAQNAIRKGLERLEGRLASGVSIS